ncbi:PTS glucose transporter subunit IIA, partial [Acinetobacter baumannii]|nr:PTS glucose transporter subunit IIA [Acinetobacter baumannii]
VPDPTFSGEVMGPGAAVDPEGDEVDVVSPAAGRVSHIFDTGHAVALTLESGADVLIHVGLDTVEMKGHGFRPLVAVGDEVLEGQPLLRVDLA